MEKFNFFKSAKISCLVLGLFSLLFSSCKEEEPNEKAPDGWNEPTTSVKQILADGFTADYPLDFPLRAFPSQKSFKIDFVGNDKHQDLFYVFITYDSTTVSKDSTTYDAAIQYMKLTTPESVKESEIDDILSVMKEYFFTEENIIVDEATKFAGYSGHRLAVNYKENNSNKYIEYNIFYVPSQKKVYIALISLSEELAKTRRDEFYKIASTFKIK